MMQSAVLLFALLGLATSNTPELRELRSSCCKDKADLTVQYTVENYLPGYEPHFGFSRPVTFTCGEPFIDVMARMAVEDGNFGYEASCMVGLGVYVTEVNGRAEDVPNGHFWNFGARNSTGDHFETSGVSTTFPQDGDHMVLIFQ